MTKVTYFFQDHFRNSDATGNCDFLKIWPEIPPHPEDGGFLAQMFSAPDFLTELFGPPTVGVRLGPSGRGIFSTAGEVAHKINFIPFGAAHFLPHLPQSHKCRRLHGHDYFLFLESPPPGIDGDGVSRFLGQFAERLLNELPGLENPTSENFSIRIWEFFLGEGVKLEHLTLFETANSGCVFNGRGHRIFKRFEAAIAFPVAGGISGSNLEIALELPGPLDPRLGWVRDFADLKAIFQPCFRAIDHFSFDQIEGFSGVGAAALARQIYDKMAPHGVTSVGVRLGRRLGIHCGEPLNPFIWF